MAYFSVENEAGVQAIAETSTTQRHSLGKIVRAKDDTLGTAGEFIYLLGVASTAIGSVVTYDTGTFATTLCAVGGNVARPVAFSMSANVASQWGWYQIGGQAVAKKQCTVSLVAGVAVGVLSTGLVAGTASGKELYGVTVAATASAAAGRTTVTLLIDRPGKQGRVT